MEAEFARLSAIMEVDAAKREAISKEVKEINRIFRSIQFTLHAVHNVCADEDAVRKICSTARKQFEELAPFWKHIFDIVAEDSVEKYRGQWRFAHEQLVFLASFTHWLDTRQLISIDQTTQMIGVGSNEAYTVPAPGASAASATPSPSTGVGLDLEDYLQGLAALPKELTRLCVNAVRGANYQLPRQISQFVSELYSGFRLLNLRNDALRRKFDAIKYDVQKIEEVMYDCTVRGLGTSAQNAAVNAASKPLAVGGDQQQQQGSDAADVQMQ